MIANCIVLRWIPFYASTKVNNNGDITFDVSSSQYTPDAFPIENRMIIAPYWADSNIRLGGDVWYRETRESDLLARARREVRAAFVTHMDFEPTWLFIATWDHVPYFGADLESDLNTVTVSESSTVHGSKNLISDEK